MLKKNLPPFNTANKGSGNMRARDEGNFDRNDGLPSSLIAGRR
jgi:hypothetical protein